MAKLYIEYLLHIVHLLLLWWLISLLFENIVHLQLLVCRFLLNFISLTFHQTSFCNALRADLIDICFWILQFRGCLYNFEFVLLSIRYFLRKLKKEKKSNDQVLAINQVQSPFFEVYFLFISVEVALWFPYLVFFYVCQMATIMPRKLF